MSHPKNDSIEIGEISSIIEQLLYQLLKNERDHEKLQLLLRLSQCIAQNQFSSIEFTTMFKFSRIALLHNLNLIVETANNVSDEIIDNILQKWRESQILGHTNEDRAMENLNKIQSCCQKLAKVLWLTLNQLKINLIYLPFVDALDDIIPIFMAHCTEDVFNLLVRLVEQTVIIEKQPPQVLSSNGKFSTTLRLLVGDFMYTKQINPSVEVSIVSEEQAQSFENIVEKSDLNSGKLKNCSGQIKFDKKSHKLVATFDALKLTKITKSEDDTNEKFGLLFQSNFSICENFLKINIKALSMPFVMNNDDSGKPASNVKCLWDNVFPVFDRKPFDKTFFIGRLKTQLWLKAVVCALSEKTSSRKTDYVMNTLVGNIFEIANLSLDATLSTDENFSESFLRGNKNNLLEWFYSAIEFTQHNLCELWNEKYIIGFIDEKSAEELLLGCEPGTFLLRFSDSKNVGLVIDYCKLNENDEKYVLHYEPLTSIDLNEISLPDRILSLVELKVLYKNTSLFKIKHYASPLINKHDAFEKYASHQKEQKPGCDPMNDETIFSRYSEIQLNSPPDSSIPTPSTFYTTPKMYMSLPSRFNFLMRCCDSMKNGEDSD